MSLKNALSLSNGGVISLVGAGGKTSLMFRMAQALSNGNETVLTTTTTRIMTPEKGQSPQVVLADRASLIIEKSADWLKDHRHLTVAPTGGSDGKKLVGLKPGVIDELWQTGRFKWIVVEADGARRKWIKAPAAHEPVIPASTRQVIGVIGVRAIGKPLSSRWVFRPERYAAITGLKSGAMITTASVATSILDPEGIMKGAPSRADRYVFLNLAGNMRLAACGRKLAHLLCRKGVDSHLTRVVIGHAGETPAVVEYYDVS